MCLLSGGDPPGRDLSSSKTSQGYMSQELSYSLEGEARVLCLFSLRYFGLQTPILLNLSFLSLVPTLQVMTEGLRLLSLFMRNLWGSTKRRLPVQVQESEC